VAPKYQDAFGYITALRTFTGRHSPEVICPDFFGLVDHELKEAADHELQGRCALCNVSSEDDPQARSYSVTYKMLAQYTAADRFRILQDLRDVSVPELSSKEMAQIMNQNQQEEPLNVQAKGSALFQLLDVKSEGKLSRMELWAGLLDYGYTVEEICVILDVAEPSSPSARSIDLTTLTQESEFEAPGEDGALTQESEFETLEEVGRYTPDFDDSEVVNEDNGHRGSTVEVFYNTAVESDTRNSTVRSPGWSGLDTEGKERKLERNRLPKLSLVVDLGQNSFESKQSTLVHVPDAKNLPKSVRKELLSADKFVKGLEAAVAAMSEERRKRFGRNVDMLGQADQAGSVTMQPMSPTEDEVSRVLNSNEEEDDDIHDMMPETTEKVTLQGTIQVNVEFAKDAVSRSMARQLAKKLPKSLENLRNVLPHSHVKRIISIEYMPEDFGRENHVWCCKKCAMKFNPTANGVFQWSDHRKHKANSRKIQRKIDNLRHLKTETETMPEHRYPVGELPALCTPRMYRALHDHTSRAYAVGPPQFTAGAVKDLISESARIREKTDFRKLRLPQLDKLPMDRPDTV
jgi:rubrerythrin